MKTSPKTTSAAENFSWLEAFKSVWYFLENDKAKFTFYFFVLMIIFFYELLPSYIVGKIIDFISSHESGESLRPFYYYVLFISTTYVLASFIRLKSKFILNNIGQNNRTRARIWGFERLTEFSLEWHNKENTGNKIQRIFTGADGIRNLSKLFTKDILRIFANITGVAVVFLFTDFKFVALIFAYIIIILYIEFAFSKKFFSLSNEFNAQNQSAGGTYMESANNMLSIKAMGGEKIMAQRVFDKETFSRDINIRKSQTVNLKWRFFQFLNGIALGVFLYFTGTSVLSNVMTIGMVLVFYTYFLKLQGSLGDMCDMHSEILDCRSDIASMMPIFKETEFIKTGKSLFPKNWKKIELKNVYMNYGSGQIGLSNFNLSLPRGSKTGIAGLSGSGKSTLTKIILGLYGLNSGSFKIGDKDYYSIAHNETISHIAVVLQETELFNLTLRENITMMHKEDKELLNKAIEISNLGEVIARLPDGIDSLIGEKGYKMSGGERQRLGIARAIYKNTPIILLDEATSSLDSETEGKIMEKLLGEFGKEKTLLIIAHRLGTLKYTDKIAVMERGSIIEEGTYNELIEDEGSVFNRMNKEKTHE